MENKESKFLDKLDQIIKDKKAPEQVGKPIYEKHIEIAKMAGIKGPQMLFGKKVDENSSEPARPYNFGAKHARKELPEDTRTALLSLKKMVNNVEVQSAVKYRGQHVTPEMMKQVPAYKNQLEPALKAFNVTDFSNWIPTVNGRLVA